MPDLDQETLDEYLAAKAAEGAPEEAGATVAPVQGYGAAPQQSWSLTPDRKGALMQKAYDEAMGTGAPDAVPAQLADVEARIGSKNVPGNSPFAGFGAALAQGSSNRAKLIEGANVSLGTKLNANQAATIGNLGGGVLENLIGKKKADYEDQLNSDAKRAQMFRALHPHNNAHSATTSLGVINAAQRDELMASNQAKYDAKVAAAQANADPNSDASKATREAMLKTGIWNPGDLDGMSHDQMMAARVARMQTARIDAGGSEADRKAHNELVNKEELARGEEQRRLADEQRKEQKHRAESEIPGIVWRNGVPPGPAAQTEVHKLLPAYRALVDGSRELADIQDKLKSRWGVATTLGQSLGVFMADQDTKNLLSRADKLREQQVNAARVAYDYGAPQWFELERLGKTFPRPGDVKSYLTGSADWKANAETADRELRAKLRERHALLPDDPEVYTANKPEPDAASQVQKIDRGAYVPYQPRTGAPAQTAGAAESVPTVSEKLPQAPVAPVAKPERATNVPSGTYVVKTKSGWSSPRQLTAAQAAHLVENGAELKAAQ